MDLKPFTHLEEVHAGDCITFLADQKIATWFYVTRLTERGVYGILQSIWCRPDSELHDHPETLIAEYDKPLPNRAPAKVIF